MLNCYCQLSSSVIFRQYGVSQSECKTRAFSSRPSSSHESPGNEVDLTYICWEIDNFVIKSDIFKRFFICKNILKKLSCYHDNYFRYFMFGKYNGFVSKARVSACMYFLVIYLKRNSFNSHYYYYTFDILINLMVYLAE